MAMYIIGAAKKALEHHQIPGETGETHDSGSPVLPTAPRFSPPGGLTPYPRGHVHLHSLSHASIIITQLHPDSPQQLLSQT